nr:hypothetical protein [Pandoravirus aubagnensis]
MTHVRQDYPKYVRYTKLSNAFYSVLPFAVSIKIPAHVHEVSLLFFLWDAPTTQRPPGLAVSSLFVPFFLDCRESQTRASPPAKRPQGKKRAAHNGVFFLRCMAARGTTA